jgi:hypothetical protein
MAGGGPAAAEGSGRAAWTTRTASRACSCASADKEVESTPLLRQPQTWERAHPLCSHCGEVCAVMLAWVGMPPCCQLHEMPPCCQLQACYGVGCFHAATQAFTALTAGLCRSGGSHTSGFPCVGVWACCRHPPAPQLCSGSPAATTVPLLAIPACMAAGAVAGIPGHMCLKHVLPR